MADAAVSHPHARPMTSWTMSMRGPERCSPMMFWANTDACSAARPRAEALPNRHDVVVDGLGQANNGEPVVVAREVGGKVGRSGVGVVSTDRVEHVDAVLDELLRGDVQGVLTLLHQAALDAVRDVGELDARIADRRAAVLVEQPCLGAHLVGDDDAVAAQQSPVAVLVRDDLDLWRDLGVPLNQPANGGRQTGGEASCGEQGNTAYRHDKPFLNGMGSPAHSRGAG